MTSVRMDKFLWAARFFKTRPLAARACELGRITYNGQPAKPAREVKVGDTVTVRNDSGDFVIEVLALSDVRGPATVAQTLYHESDASKAARQQVLEAKRAAAEFEVLPAGRPNKRNRRDLNRLRGRN